VGGDGQGRAVVVVDAPGQALVLDQPGVVLVGQGGERPAAVVGQHRAPRVVAARHHVDEPGVAGRQDAGDPGGQHTGAVAADGGEPGPRPRVGVDGAGVGRRLDRHDVARLDQQPGGERHGLLGAGGHDDLLGGRRHPVGGVEAGQPLAQGREPRRVVAVAVGDPVELADVEAEGVGGQVGWRGQHRKRQVDDGPARQRVAGQLTGPEAGRQLVQAQLGGAGVDHPGAAAPAALDDARGGEQVVGGDHRAPGHPEGGGRAPVGRQPRPAGHVAPVDGGDHGGGQAAVERRRAAVPAGHDPGQRGGGERGGRGGRRRGGHASHRAAPAGGLWSNFGGGWSARGDWPWIGAVVPARVEGWTPRPRAPCGPWASRSTP
jgi:hypothetical protein